MSPIDFRLVPPALGCWAITLVGLLVPTSITVSAVVGAVVVTVVAVWQAVRDPRRWAVVGLVVATSGLIAGVGAALVVRLDVVEQHRLRALTGHRTSVVLVVTDDPQWLAPNGSQLRIKVTVRAVGRDGDGRGRSVRAADAVVVAAGELRGEWAVVWPGQRVAAIVGVRAPPGHDLTVAKLTAASAPTLLDAGPWYQRASAEVRWRFGQVAQRALPADQAGLLPGLVIGDTGGIDDDVRDDFRQASLTHLLAVSGANFALVTGAAILAVGLLGAGPRTTAIIGVVVIVGFVILVRPSPSVVRAAAMGIVGVLAMAASRRSHAMPALGTAIIVALVVWPAMALDAGFAMSVAASAALIAWGGPTAEWLRAHRVPNGLAQLLAMAAVAQVVTAPLVAMIGGRFSVVGVAANVVVAPVVGAISILGAVAAAGAALGGVAEIGAELLIRALGPELWWMLACAHAFGGQRWASIAVPDGVGGALLVAGLTAVSAGAVRWLWQHRHGDRPFTPLAWRRRLSSRAGDQRGRRAGSRNRRRAGSGQPDPGG